MGTDVDLNVRIELWTLPALRVLEYAVILVMGTNKSINSIDSK